MQNFTWRFFLETEIHQKLSRIHARNKGINTIVTGYPGMDIFLQKGYNPIDDWKIKNRKIKRIIWAPHHTISGMGASLDYSTFLSYSELMLQLAEKYKNEIQIAFKPHPVLRPNLSKEEVWGKNKTDEYYQKWADLPNGLLEEGNYIDLFLTSDGMIHDSSSFVIEYLYTNKPVMFLINNDSIPDKFNEIGKMAFSKLYHGKSQKDIEEFIRNVIIRGKDIGKEERIEFFDSIVKPPNNRSASENIFNNLKLSIFGEQNRSLD
jgi:CDP-glycerol glycerophosphotransferase (TagB/SpsB family)